jgi:hypothetical protein
MKLYTGGYGVYQEMVCAKDEADAIRKIGEKVGAPHLPIVATWIECVDGYQIRAVNMTEKPEPELKASAAGLFYCHQCEYAGANKGELMAHYRIKHPKGG